MSAWQSFFVVIAAIACWGIYDSAVRVARWCHRGRNRLPQPVSDDRDWQTKFYQEHQT